MIVFQYTALSSSLPRKAMIENDLRKIEKAKIKSKSHLLL